MPTVRTLVVVVLLVASLAGCTEKEPEVVYVDRPVTVTVQPKVQDFLQIVSLDNRGSVEYEVRIQGYSLTATGEHSKSGYAIKSIRATVGKQTLTADNYPKCNDKMEGIYGQVWSGGQKLDDGYWSGVHCTGDSAKYSLTVMADGDLRFGKNP